MKFEIADVKQTENKIEFDLPEWLSSAGEWGNLYQAIFAASHGQRGTAAKQIVEVIERVRKETQEMAYENGWKSGWDVGNKAGREGHPRLKQAKVEAYLVGWQDGWGEACEVEHDNQDLAHPRRYPVSDARKGWQHMTEAERNLFREQVSTTIDLAVSASNKHHEMGVSQIAKEVINDTAG